MSSWENECYSCRKETHRREIIEQIKSGEIIETDCEDDIFCPHCGYVYEIDDEYYLREDGEHRMQCPDCEKDFIVTTSVSYCFGTSRE